MSKLSTKKIIISDYSKVNQDDMSKLARSLNPLMDDLERMFRKGMTVEDNLPFQYVTFSCEVDSTGTPKSVIKLNTSLTTTIKGSIVVNATNSTTYPTAMPYAVIDVVGNTVQIKKVLGIPQDTVFDITLLVVS